MQKILLFFLFLFSYSAAFAQKEPQQQDTLTESEISLRQVVISAARWNQSAYDVPNHVVRISRQTSALQNPQTAADLLGLSGEVFIQKSQQGGGSPMFRGFGTNRLLYAVDGVRMNTAIFRAGNLQNVISLDPFAIEQTEILFGPGSVMYGSDAIGGVMSFQTLAPKFSQDDLPYFTGSAVTRFSSANQEMSAHFDVNVGFKRWAFLTSFSHNRFGDLRQGAYGPEEYLRPFYVERFDSADVVVANTDPLVQRPTGYNQMNLMQKVRFSPNANWDLQYAFHYSATSGYARYDRLQRTGNNGLPRSAEWLYGPQLWMMNQFTLSHKGGNAAYDEMALRLAHQFFEESRIERNFNNNERRLRLEKVVAYSVNADFVKTLSDNHKLYYGLEFVVNDVRSTGTNEDISTNTVLTGPSRYPQSTWASYAAYLTYQFRVSENFLLQGGLRYNQFGLDQLFDTTFYPFPYTTSTINNGALTGSLGAVYHPSPDWSLRLNLSTGFRSPNVDDAGKVFDSQPGSVVVPNPGLKAEYAYNAEVGMAKVFGETLKIDVSAYYTQLQNALAVSAFPFNGADSIFYDGELSRVLANQNNSSARVYGVQVGLELKLNGGWGLSSHFNYQTGSQNQPDGTSTPLPHMTPIFGITHLTYTYGGLLLDAYAQYCGQVPFEDLPVDEVVNYLYAKNENGDPYAPSWYTLNLKAMYKITKNFSVSAGLENLLDWRYRPVRSGVSAAGRNFVVSFSAKF